ncbi:glycosyltransferase family 2 protein, partial [Rodentibacter trehalosifermentans]|uniref:glycosyltransferase family 2 protein n=1 Tax=Rodentibacter trehalosifermentans TaxID=1908263 RepID=UPI0009852F92
MNDPLISIIIPVYNSSNYLVQALNSCLNQSYSNIEIIVVDDGSTDNSVNIIKEMMSQDIRIKLFFTPSNQGPAIARNIGLENSSGEYITSLDSDDFIESNKLEKQVTFMLENNVSMTHGNYSFCDLDGNNIKSIKTSEKINYNTLLKGNQFKIMTVLIKKETVSNLRFPKIRHE